MSLEKLEFDDLKEIAQKENIALPQNVDTEKLAQLIAMYLTPTKIKKYVKEYYEEQIERETVIKEKITRKSVREENTTVEFSREKMMVDLAKLNISKTVLEEVSHYLKSPFASKKNVVEQFGAMNDKLLDSLFRAFVRSEKDSSGRFFEWRFAEYCHDKLKCEKVTFREKLLGKDSVPYEIDIVGRDKEGNIFLIAECKAKGGSPLKEDVAKWLAATEQIKKTMAGDKLERSIFASTSPFTQDVVKLVKGRGGEDGTMKVTVGSISQYLSGSMGIRGNVSLQMHEELQGQIKRIYP